MPCCSCAVERPVSTVTCSFKHSFEVCHGCIDSFQIQSLDHAFILDQNNVLIWCSKCRMYQANHTEQAQQSLSGKIDMTDALVYVHIKHLNQAAKKKKRSHRGQFVTWLMSKKHPVYGLRIPF